MLDTGLLLLRLVVGLYLVGHGTQKLFGWFGGHGLAATAAGMGKLGLRPARLWALNAGPVEAGGGLLLALGLLSPLGSLGIIAAMLVASLTVHWRRGLFNQTGGPELPVAYLTAALALALTGPGRYSLDRWLRLALPEPATGLVVGALVVAGVALALATRRPDAGQAARAPA